MDVSLFLGYSVRSSWSKSIILVHKVYICSKGSQKIKWIVKEMEILVRAMCTSLSIRLIVLFLSYLVYPRTSSISWLPARGKKGHTIALNCVLTQNRCGRHWAALLQTKCLFRDVTTCVGLLETRLLCNTLYRSESIGKFAISWLWELLGVFLKIWQILV